MHWVGPFTNQKGQLTDLLMWAYNQVNRLVNGSNVTIRSTVHVSYRHLPSLLQNTLIADSDNQTNKCTSSGEYSVMLNYMYIYVREEETTFLLIFV